MLVRIKIKKKRFRYITYINPQLACALQILQNEHKYGPMEATNTLLHYSLHWILSPTKHYNMEQTQMGGGHPLFKLTYMTYKCIIHAYNSPLPNLLLVIWLQFWVVRCTGSPFLYMNYRFTFLNISTWSRSNNVLT